MGGGSLRVSVAPSDSVTRTRASLLSTPATLSSDTVTGNVPMTLATGGAFTFSFTSAVAHSMVVSRRPTTVPGPTPLSGGFTTSIATRVLPTFGSFCTRRTAASPFVSVNVSASFPPLPLKLAAVPSPPFDTKTAAGPSRRR